jgi:hypothetical protein
MQGVNEKEVVKFVKTEQLWWYLAKPRANLPPSINRSITP